MSDEKNFSDERLNAFIDNELDEQEREAVLAAMAEDDELSRRLCLLRSTKDLLRHAYDRVPAPAQRRPRRVPLWGGALAAGMALVVGVLVGWQGHQAAATARYDSVLAWAGGLFAPQPARVLIHLDNSQVDHMEEALDLAEAYMAGDGKAKVELVVNNSGLDLLREETTPHAERIARLAARYEMLAFVACGNAVARYRSAGLDVTLVPEARVERTAVEHIVGRVRQGWTYLKI